MLTKEQYKNYQKKLNEALDNALFQQFADVLDDQQFDIDNKADRLAMKIKLETASKEVNRSKEKKDQFRDALNLISDLNDLYDFQMIEEAATIEDTKKNLKKFQKQAENFSDFNENGNNGTDFKNERKERKFNKRQKEQREIEDIKKDFMDAIYKIDEIDDNGKDIIKWAIEKGELDPDDMKESLAKSYVNATMPEKQAAMTAARK